MHQRPLTPVAIPLGGVGKRAPKGVDVATVVSAWLLALGLTAGFAGLSLTMLVVALASAVLSVLALGPAALLITVGALLATRLFFRGAALTTRYVAALTQQLRESCP